MSESFYRLRVSGAARFYNSLAPSTRAALIFSIPFTIVDAIHYYTAGTAVVISLPIVLLVYLVCGVVAAKLALHLVLTQSEIIREGMLAGIKLWGISTLINTIISLIVGAASLGATLFLGIPYLCLCAPVYAVGGALTASVGSYAYWNIHNRTIPKNME
jgi:hypothetical protein